MISPCRREDSWQLHCATMDHGSHYANSSSSSLNEKKECCTGAGPSRDTVLLGAGHTLKELLAWCSTMPLLNNK